jgi:hypothetical protein
MFAANSYVIRTATPADRDLLERIARLDTQASIVGPALIGEIGGVAAAGISVEDGRVVADPFMHTANLVALLRMRQRARRAAGRTPSVADRLRAGVRVHRPATT